MWGQPQFLTALAVARDLQPDLAPSAEVVAALAVSREGNPRSWTLRLAHGVSDIVLDHFERVAAERDGPGKGAIVFQNADAADPLDQEFISVLLRRAEPERVSVRVVGRTGRFEALLAEALRDRAKRIRVGSNPGTPRPNRAVQQGEDPEMLLAAATDCMKKAYYEAALAYARRGLNVLGSSARGQVQADLRRHVIFASLLLGRYDDVEAACRNLRPDRDEPTLLAHAAYAMAILNARLYDPSRHDYDAAKAWIEQSLAFTQTLPSSEVRSVNIAFLHNTMALVEMRKGRLAAALRRLNGAVRLMAREAPSRYRAESVILLHNRARLRRMMGRPDRAIADLTTLLRQEPSDSDAYLDRGLLHQRAGRYAKALADYDAAIAWSPPFETAHFNRAQTLTALGRPDEAMKSYGRVLEMNPQHLEARINRACLLFARGDHGSADRDVDALLAHAPDNSRALCLRGLLLQARGALAEAYQYFTAAIAAEPGLADAWANRAAIAHRRGDTAATLADLSAALDLREDPVVLCNRARVFEGAGRWSEAEADYRRALEIAPRLEGVDERLRRVSILANSATC
jgi:tetratricopeptide (TPR) repeat protein